MSQVHRMMSVTTNSFLYAYDGLVTVELASDDKTLYGHLSILWHRRQPHIRLRGAHEHDSLLLTGFTAVPNVSTTATGLKRTVV